jgi:predicted deacylase
MLGELPARGVRVGGVTVAPGEMRAVTIALAAPPRPSSVRSVDRGVPAWVVVGAKPGPRVSVVAAVDGVETTAARAARVLCVRLAPEELAGSVVIVPVLRPAGRLAARGRPAPPMRFPGDAAGKRAERDAFALFSAVVVGAHALLVLAAPRRGRRGTVVVRGALDDPRVRRLALGSGAVAALSAKPRPGSLLAAAAEAQVVGLTLSAAGPLDDFRGEQAGAAGEDLATGRLADSVRTLLVGLGMLAPTEVGAGGAERAVRPPVPVIARKMLRVRAAGDGFLEAPVAPGGVVRARAILGRLSPLLPGRPTSVPAPAAGLVIEAAPPGPVRAGATLFVLVPLAPGSPTSRGLLRGAAAGAPGAAAGDRAPTDGKTRVGWVEHVGLPGLEIKRLKAKIDTGARTSALHVMRMRTIDTTGGPHRRPILEITVPGGGRGRRPHVVRAAVRDFVVVRDTSGRTERRPVIETALKLGPIKRRIAVTLTNRGDMLFPMLVGRTALGPGVVVDPSRRYLLGRT